MSKKNLVGFRVDDDMNDKLHHIAVNEQKSVSAVARILLEIGIEEYRRARKRAESSSNLLQILDRK